MTKIIWDELMSTPRKILKESKDDVLKLLCQHVLNQVVLFEPLQSSQKQKLLDQMKPISYISNEYICKQGVTGNCFYIITSGSCKATIINNIDDKEEREIQILKAGDFFGEQSLKDKSYRRPHNVIAIEPVSCLTLNRSDFTSFIKIHKVKSILGIESQGKFKINALYSKRRISIINTHGLVDESRSINIFRRFSKFATESLWLSLYSRLFRRVTMDPSKLKDYGSIVTEVINSCTNRFEAISAIRRKAIIASNKDWFKKTDGESCLTYALFSQRNMVYDRICKDWPIHQFKSLCKTIKIETIEMFRKVLLLLFIINIIIEVVSLLFD